MHGGVVRICTLALALAAPALMAAEPSQASARAGIEKAQAAIESARQPRAGEAQVTKPGSRERSLLRAQRELDLANGDLAAGSFKAAQEHALRASVFAWRATSPRKGAE